MTKNAHSLPLSIEDFFRKVEEDCLCSDEVLLLQELVKLPLLADMLEWSESEGKLDLHGLHLSSAYVIILQWMEELRLRFSMENIVPVEVSIICGSGKHSKSIGKSHVKSWFRDDDSVKESLRIDRKNIGRFIANGKRIKDWLC
ncbi:hypothetical protein HPP92_004921 [Vanilla planifolia]|uniref:Smr domain-containing protein n=1 Tax=Vanilla planifolia TaxID=51239 RepID=A0A835RSU1_VANPL|nr:hypothetical protein HPP92_004921 [Vanilla planifolia]